jgi:hypothetical protein
MYGGEERFIIGFWWKSLKHFQDLDIDGRIYKVRF